MAATQSSLQVTGPTIGPGYDFCGYKLNKLLGEGTFNTVYDVIDKGIRKAIKINKVEVDSSLPKDDILDFIVPISIISGYLLNAEKIFVPNLVVGKNNDCAKWKFAILLEAADSGLLDYVAKNPSVKSILDLLFQMASGIRVLHSFNILHRDIKPDNVLVINNVAKIADFGLAMLLPDIVKGVNTFRFGGTPNYLAPELAAVFPQIAAGQKIEVYYNYSSDIWSLGVTFLELIARTRTPPTPNWVQLLRENDKTASIKNLFIGTTLVGRYGDALAVIINNMLSFDRAKRPTAAIVANRIAKVYEEVAGISVEYVIPRFENFIPGIMSDVAYSIYRNAFDLLIDYAFLYNVSLQCFFYAQHILVQIVAETASSPKILRNYSYGFYVFASLWFANNITDREQIFNLYSINKLKVFESNLMTVTNANVIDFTFILLRNQEQLKDLAPIISDMKKYLEFDITKLGSGAKNTDFKSAKFKTFAQYWR